MAPGKMNRIINASAAMAVDRFLIEALETRVMFDASTGVWLKDGIVHVQLSAEMSQILITTLAEPEFKAGEYVGLTPKVAFQPFGDSKHSGVTGKAEEFRLADIKGVVIEGAEGHSLVAIHEWDYTGYDFKIELTGERKNYSVFRYTESESDAKIINSFGIEGAAKLLNGNADDLVNAPEPIDPADPTPTATTDSGKVVETVANPIVSTVQFKLTPFSTQVLREDLTDVWD